MGLLSKAETIDFAELNSAKQNSIIKKISFSEFICKNKITSCALFENIDDKYFITNSVGFDANTIISSESTKDFWNGLCSENSVKNFSKKENTISPLLQFFSFTMSENLESISVFKTANKVLIVCNKEITAEMKNQFLQIENNFSKPECENLSSLINSKSKCLNCTINFEEAIDSFLSSNVKDKNVSAIFKKSLFNEFANRIIGYTNIDAVKVFEDDSYKVKAIFVTKNDTPFQLLMTHLIMNLREVIGDFSDLLEIFSEENCQTFMQLKNFLQEE